MDTQYVLNPQEGIERAKNILYKSSDTNTALFLSGGRTPRELYEDLAREKKLQAGAVAMIDERFGEKFHKNSNERMLRESGLLDYLRSQKITFYPILNATTRDETAIAYENQIKKLFEKFPKRVGVLGIGLDGHTASLPVQAKNFESRTEKLVLGIDNFPIEPRKRITLTFRALEKMSFLLVLVFGEDKKKALKIMLEEGSEDEIPARFFTRVEIAQKTLFITDQKV